MENMANLKQLSKSVLTKVTFVTVVLVLIVSLGVAHVQAKATTVTTNFRTDLNLSVFVPCAARGAGEYIQLSGPLHIVFVTTLDGKGGFQSKYEFQPKGVTGTGLSTGITYHGTGTTHGTINGTVGTTSSFGDSFKVTGKGGNFLVRVDARINVTPSGTVIVILDNYSVTCKRPGYPSYP